MFRFYIFVIVNSLCKKLETDVIASEQSERGNLAESTYYQEDCRALK